MSNLPVNLRESIVVDSDEIMLNFENLEARGALSEHLAQDDTATSGLQFGYLSGRVRTAAGALLSVAAGAIALTPSATNYVQINPETGAVSVSTSSFASSKIPLRLITTDSASILTNLDKRTWAVLGGGSGSTPLATESVEGKAALSVAPATSGVPIAVGANDPRLAASNFATEVAAAVAAEAALRAAADASEITNRTYAVNTEAAARAAADALKADLVSGKVPASQLPSYVDDVEEYANLAAFPGTGEAGKIYVAIDTNLPYRWSGSAYVGMSSALALGETSSTAYRGDRGKTAYDHSQATGNPHGLTAAIIGLGNVTNLSASNLPVSTAQEAALDLKLNASEKGANSGVAELDSSGYLPLARFPLSLLGALRYQTAWNASTNSPNIGASSPSKGYYWIVSVAGSTSLSGITDWQIGDHVVWNGTAWDKYDYCSDPVVTTDIADGVLGRFNPIMARDFLRLSLVTHPNLLHG